MDGNEWIVVNGFFPFAKLTATSSLQTGCLIRCGTETMPCYKAHWVSCFRLKQRTVCCFTIASIVGFFFFLTATCFFSFSLALRHIFLHILVQYVTNTVMVTWVHITSSTEQSWLNQTDHGFIHYDRLSQPEVHLRRDRLSLFPCECWRQSSCFSVELRQSPKSKKNWCTSNNQTQNKS